MAFFNIIIFTPCQKLICWLRYLSICISKINNDFCEWNHLFWKEFSYYTPTHTIFKKLKNFLRIRFMKKRLHHINSTQSRKQIPKNEIFFSSTKKSVKYRSFQFSIEWEMFWMNIFDTKKLFQPKCQKSYPCTYYLYRCLIY